MTQQVVQARKISPLLGVLLILGLMAAVLFFSMLGKLIDLYFRIAWGALIAWLLAGILAVDVIRRRIMEYRYTVNNARVYIERMYGAHYSKVLLDIPVTDIVATGTLAELNARYPDMRYTRRAYLSSNPLEKVYYVYRDKGAYELLLIQPDEAMRKALYDPEKRRATAETIWGA